MKNNKYYIGSTYDLDKRVSEHNEGKVKSTKSNRPRACIILKSSEMKKMLFYVKEKSNLGKVEE